MLTRLQIECLKDKETTLQLQVLRGNSTIIFFYIQGLLLIIFLKI